MKKILSSMFLALSLLVGQAQAADDSIVIATNPTWPPMQFVDMDKKIVGFEVNNYDDLNGTMNVNIKLKSSVAQMNGVASNVDLGVITLRGFNSRTATTFNPDATITIDASDTILSDFSAKTVTEAAMKEYIVAHGSQFYNNPAEGTSASNIVNVKMVRDEEHNQVTLTFALNRYISALDGSLVTNETVGVAPLSSHTYVIQGFKKRANGTTIVKDGKLSGVKSYLASDLATSPTAQAAFLQSIVTDKMILNPAEGTTIGTGDLEVESVPAFNNITGTATVNLKIKNGRYWEEAIVAPEKTITANFSGFKLVTPTTFVTDGVTIPGASNFSEVYATPADVNTTMVKQFIITNRAKFFNDPTNLISLDNITDLSN